MKFLVTGAAGFLGSHLSDRLLAEGHSVVGIDNLIGGYKDNVPTKVDFFKLDLVDLERIRPHFEGVDVVIHTACTAYEGLSVFSPSLVNLNTSQITSTALSASIQAGVKKFIYMSSMARYGTQKIVPFTEDMTPNPQDPYGISKYSSELLVRNISETHGMKYTILVPHNIIGPRQKYNDPYRNVASIMVNRMMQGKQPIIYGDGSQKRCFSFIQDVVDPILVACDLNSVNKETINIGPDEEFVSILELAELIAEKMEFELHPIFMPDRPQEVKDANCSADKARKLLNYETKTNLSDGLDELIGWIRKRGESEFEYHLPIEIINEATPKTWTKKLI